jgi:hypothetical protein
LAEKRYRYSLYEEEKEHNKLVEESINKVSFKTGVQLPAVPPF